MSVKKSQKFWRFLCVFVLISVLNISHEYIRSSNSEIIRIPKLNWSSVDLSAPVQSTLMNRSLHRGVNATSKIGNFLMIEKEWYVHTLYEWTNWVVFQINPIIQYGRNEVHVFRFRWFAVLGVIRRPCVRTKTKWSPTISYWISDKSTKRFDLGTLDIMSDVYNYMEL